MKTGWLRLGKAHQFDCVKYAYLARDFAVNAMPRNAFRFLKSPMLLRRWEKYIKKQEKLQQSEARCNKWFSKD